jgi:parvulin-like peptidyl-prolyl isomerase
VGTPAPTSTTFPTSTPITLQGYQGLVKKYITNAQLDITNMSESALRNIMENTLYRQKMLAAVTKDLKPEVQQVWARHILVADEATAKDIVNQLNNGGDFAKLAAQYSTDTSNKDTGGDLGWFSSGQMVAEFEKAAFALKVGEISAPVQTQSGWHVIQSLGNEVRPLDASQFDTLKQTTFQDYLNKLISDDKNIKKLDVWMQVVPGDPTLPPLPTAAPSGQ